MAEFPTPPWELALGEDDPLVDAAGALSVAIEEETGGHYTIPCVEAAHELALHLWSLAQALRTMGCSPLAVMYLGEGGLLPLWQAEDDPREVLIGYDPRWAAWREALTAAQRSLEEELGVVEGLALRFTPEGHLVPGRPYAPPRPAGQ